MSNTLEEELVRLDSAIDTYQRAQKELDWAARAMMKATFRVKRAFHENEENDIIRGRLQPPVANITPADQPEGSDRVDH